MKNKEKIIIIVTIILVVLVSVVLGVLKIKSDNKNPEGQNRVQSFDKPALETKYNNETGMYYVETPDGKIHESQDESNLHIYTIDPDFNPNPLGVTEEE